MNPSTTPANNETVAYGQLLAQTSKLKRGDQILLVKALAGQLGMIAMFPGQLTQSAVSSGPAKAGKERKAKGPAKQAPTNPLSGTAEKKAFDAAKKAVAKATKESGEQKLASTHPLVVALESAKDQYFRSLSSAKGENASPAKPAKDGGPAKAGSSSAAKGGSPPKAAAPAKPAAQDLRQTPKGVWEARLEGDWHKVPDHLVTMWRL